MHRCTYVFQYVYLVYTYCKHNRNQSIAHTPADWPCTNFNMCTYVHVHMYVRLAELTAVNGRNYCFSQILFFWLAKLLCIWQLNLKFMICHSQGIRAGTARVGSSYLKVLFSWPPSFKIICIQLKTLFCLNPWYCCFYFLYWCPNLT